MRIKLECVCRAKITVNGKLTEELICASPDGSSRETDEGRVLREWIAKHDACALGGGTL